MSLQPSTATRTSARFTANYGSPAGGVAAEPVPDGGGLAEPADVPPLEGVALPVPDGVVELAPLPVSPEPVGGGVTTLGCTTSFALRLLVMRELPSVHALASRY